MDKRPLNDETVTQQLAAAEASARTERDAGLRAIAVRYDVTAARILLELSNGYLLGVPIATLPDLATATPQQLAQMEISPQGGVLRVPALDADYSVPGLVFAMSASEIGRRGGLASSALKKQSSRRNGAKGGRPKKSATDSKVAVELPALAPTAETEAVAVAEKVLGAPPKLIIGTDGQT